MTLPGPDYLAPAKLNLFLHVVGRRPDGYHLLQTAFMLLDHGDTLRFRPREDGQIVRVSELADVAPDDDLVVRAARLLQSTSGHKHGVDIEVEKHLPMGGGLGGGSSDAATTLVVLNHRWRCGFSRERLQALGLTLGADVPVFIHGVPALAEGVGEVLHPLALPAWWALVACPPVQIATASVFTAPELTRNTIPLRIADFSPTPPGNWLAGSRNDLEAVVRGRQDAAGEVVREVLLAVQAVAEDSILARQCGRGGRMTGSGACVFALFESEQGALSAQAALRRRRPDVQSFVAQSLNRHPLFDLCT